MSDLVGNPEDRFSRVAAQLLRFPGSQTWENHQFLTNHFKMVFSSAILCHSVLSHNYYIKYGISSKVWTAK